MPSVGKSSDSFYVSESNKVGLLTDKSGSCPCSDLKTPKAPCSRTLDFVYDSLNVVVAIAVARLAAACACALAAAAAVAARLVKACVVRGVFRPTVVRT